MQGGLQIKFEFLTALDFMDISYYNSFHSLAIRWYAMIPEDVFHQKSEKEREALGVLYPSSLDLPDRIKLITTTRGKPPTITALYQAKVIFSLLDTMDGGKEPKEVWHDIDASKFFEEHAPSIGGRHAERAVDIARAGPQPESPTLSWLQKLLVGKK